MYHYYAEISSKTIGASVFFVSELGFLKTREGKETFLFFVALVALHVAGTLGYMFIEGWSFLDSLYMTVITVSTVGFKEVHELSDPGRVFTMGLIGLGVGLVMLALTSLAGKVLARQVFWVFERKNMQEKIDAMVDHIIVCGYGRLSRVACEELKHADSEIVVVDSSPERCEEAEREGFLVHRGDATLDETLIGAGVKQAKSLVTLLPSDSDNLYVVLSSRESNSGLFILTRAENEVGERRLKQAGANRIISPYRIGGQKIAGGLLRPYVTDFLDLAASSVYGDLQIEEIKVPAESKLNGLKLSETDLRQKTNIIIAAMISQEGVTTFNPAGDAVVEGGSTLIGIGRKDDFRGVESLILEKKA